ncbi:MAG: hypothetical protein R3B70_49475, partial [Polyangiaceae bacterium]
MTPRATMLFFAAATAGAFGWAAGCSAPGPKEPETGKAVGPPQNIVCPEGQTLQGGTCVASAPPKVTCADGEVEKEGQCVAAAAPTCPAGTHAGADGKTCVADETPDQRKAPDPKPCPEGMALVKGGTYKMAFLKTEATVGDVCLDVTEATTKSYE